MGNFPLQQNKLWQNCPLSFWNIDSRKAGREKAARKRWATQNVREKHLGDGKETAIDSTPEHFSILQIMTSHPVRQSDSEKSEGGGLWRDGTKADDIQGEIEAEIAILLVIIFLQMMCVHVCACSGLSSPHCCECYRQCCVQCCRVKVPLFLVWQLFSKQKKVVIRNSISLLFVPFYYIDNIRCLCKMSFPLLRGRVDESDSLRFKKWFTDSFPCSLLYSCHNYSFLICSDAQIKLHPNCNNFNKLYI